MNKNDIMCVLNMIQLGHDNGTEVNSWQQSDKLSQ